MLGFMDTVLAENFNLADNPATTALRCLVIAETSILQTLMGQFLLVFYAEPAISSNIINLKLVSLRIIRGPF